MIAYMVHRLLSSVVLIALIMVVGFGIMVLPPGDYATYYVAQMAGQGTSSGEEVDQIRRMYGLDKPVTERFVTWAAGFVRGDFGMSFVYNKPVRDLIGEQILLTIALSFMSLLIAWVIGVPLGVYSATHQYKVGDHFFTLISFVGLGIPDFMLALVLLVVGTNLLGYVPMGLFSPPFQDAPWSLPRVWDLMGHMWIPALIVAVTGTAGLMRVMRGNLLDVLRLDYVQAARAKGVPEQQVVGKHAVRNAIHPLIMSLGMSFPELISGATITGIVLSLPIMGPMYLQAMRQHDIYLGGTLLILVTLMLVFGNLVGDLLLALVDPRIRYS
jgi:peptide/nickel transport system permease protein